MSHTIRIVVRCINHYPITPTCDIIDLEWETWREFLFADQYRRIEIVCSVLNSNSAIWQPDKIREVAWIPLENQDKLIERVEFQM